MSHRLSAPEVRLDTEKERPPAVQRHASDVGSAAVSFRNKVSMHMPHLGELRRASLTSSMVKANPKVRRVPSDRTHVGAFQKLLATFDDVPADCGDSIRGIVTALNSMLQSVISALVTDIDNAKIAREGSVHAITLFVHGVQEVATEVQNPVLATLLNDLSHRILQLDRFVRGYFILETMELDQVIAALDDSLDQAHSRVKALQDELKAMVHTHKRKIAEAKLMAVIHDAKVAKVGDPALHKPTTSPPPDTPTQPATSSAAAYTFANPDEDVYDVNARLTKDVSELNTALVLARSQLDSALREVQVLKAEVETLGEATYKDLHVQRLTSELNCERKRVKALEIEIHDLRIKQAELAKGVLQKHSLVHRFRSTVQPTPAASTEEDGAAVADSSADEQPRVAEVNEPPPTSAILPGIQTARHTFKVMINLDVKLSDILSPSKRSMSAAANVTHAVVKLKAKLLHKTHQGSAAPAELVALRHRISALYDRKRHYDEFSALLPRGDRGAGVSFLELSLGWFFVKYSKLQDAETEAKAFMAALNRFRSICGHVWLMEEFLHGKHSDETVSFYLWVVQGVGDVKMGAACPQTPDTHPQFICKFKASLLNRTIFRALRFHTCGFGSASGRGGDLARNETLEVMVDCHRLFTAAAAGGPMYLGEFHAVLDKFATTNDGGDEVYPLDVYLYLVVLLFNKQKEWHVAHVVGLFRKEAMDAIKEEMRRKAQADALLAATVTSKKKTNQDKTKPRKKPKRHSNASALSKKAAMTKEAFGVFLAKLDLVLPFGDIQEVTCHVLRSRCEYDGGGITPDAFVAAAHKGGWFALDFAARMSLRDELQDHAADHDLARRQLSSTWSLHLSRLSVHGERDRNVFVARHAVHQRQHVTLALSPQDTPFTTNPNDILTRCRELLQFSWQLAVLRCRGGDGDGVSTLDMARSSELILIAKGICSLPDVGPVHLPDKPHHADESGDEDDLHPFTVIKVSAIRDLFPKGTPSTMLASEGVELHRILQRYGWHLCEIFRSYSLVCNAAFGLTFPAFQELAQDMHVVSPHCTIVHINAVFHAVVTRTDKAPDAPDEDKITKDMFVELLVRLAVERHTREARVSAPTPNQDDDDDRRVSRIFDHFVTHFLLPNVCQAANHTFRQEVAALDVQRLLLQHRRFLRRVFLHYAKQDTMDVERSKMNFAEFEAFVSEFELNDAVLFPPSMTLLVFNSVQDDVDERQCVFHEFTTAIVAIAQMKNNNPFLKWRRKTDEFIGSLLDFAHAHLRPLLLA